MPVEIKGKKIEAQKMGAQKTDQKQSFT